MELYLTIELLSFYGHEKDFCFRFEILFFFYISVEHRELCSLFPILRYKLLKNMWPKVAASTASKLFPVWLGRPRKLRGGGAPSQIFTHTPIKTWRMESWELFSDPEKLWICSRSWLLDPQLQDQAMWMPICNLDGAAVSFDAKNINKTHPNSTGWILQKNLGLKI